MSSTAHDTIYGVGDVHGQLEELERALALIEADGGRDAEIVFVGDYIDRGRDSRAVIQRLLEGVDAGRSWTCLKGNHDRMMEWFFEEEPRHDPHLLIGFHCFHDRIGGVETLASYGVEIPPEARMKDLQKRARNRVPESHLDFLRDLKTRHVAGDMLFVHAGIRPNVPLEEQTEEDLLWIRHEFLQSQVDHGPLIVHGHTPVVAPEHAGNRVNLDGGAGYGRRLVPVAFEDGRAFALTAFGREEIKPPGNRV